MYVSASACAFTQLCTIVIYVSVSTLPGGHLSREVLRNLPGSSNGLVKKFIDKKGRRRHVGVPERLKASQHFGCNFTFHGMQKNRKSHVLFCVEKGSIDKHRSLYVLHGAQGPTQLTLETVLPVWQSLRGRRGQTMHDSLYSVPYVYLWLTIGKI